jgi:hypothetical protein
MQVKRTFYSAHPLELAPRPTLSTNSRHSTLLPHYGLNDRSQFIPRRALSSVYSASFILAQQRLDARPIAE